MMKMGFLVGRGHLSAIIKMSSNAIKVVMAYFVDGEIGRMRDRGQEVREGGDWHRNGRDSDIVKKALKRG
jgi:hypothetical protein